MTDVFQTKSDVDHAAIAVERARESYLSSRHDLFGRLRDERVVDVDVRTVRELDDERDAGSDRERYKVEVVLAAKRDVDLEAPAGDVLQGGVEVDQHVVGHVEAVRARVSKGSHAVSVSVTAKGVI